MQWIDNAAKMRYNTGMEKIDYAVIGGGASGLVLVNALARQLKQQNSSARVVLFERLDRVGKKLSSTGNGQGNVSNLRVLDERYFSSSDGQGRVEKTLRAYDGQSLARWFAELGVPLCADERGRVYPASRQASSLTDALRFALAEGGVETKLGARVVALQTSKNGLLIETEENGERKRYQANAVALCTGGKAAKNFGTDGSAYALAEVLGHTLSPLYPSLVQLKTELAPIKGLKGIRVTDANLTVFTPKEERSFQGDVIFTDYGVSGDAVFRASAFVTDEIGSGKVRLSIDFLPTLTEAEILDALHKKTAAFPRLERTELLFGVVNNQIGRAICRITKGDLRETAKLVKNFPLQVVGSLGFDYAQVTKGGVRLSEVTDGLESRIVPHLFFAGEVLDVDGQCGGFNLQWAYASARRVAEEMLKTRGQV